jgi:hypothetical protein
MLPLEFILTDAHFAIGLLVAMACFATGWLYFDAWVSKRRDVKDLLKWLGFGTLAAGFVITATEVEPAFLGQTLWGGLGAVDLLLRAAGYGLLAAGLALDPLQAIPKIDHDAYKRPPAPAPAGPPAPAREAVPASNGQPPQTGTPPKPLTGGLALSWGSSQVGIPLLAGAVMFLYWRRATKGLERHLKPVMWAFVWFTVFELVDLAVLGRGTADPRLYDVVAPFGPLWVLAQAVLAVAAVVLGRWVWQYLTKRLQTQLFMVLTTACLVIFLVTTVSFTFLLMTRVQNQAFESLNTTAKVLNTSIASKQAETIAAAEVVAQNSDVAAAVTAKDHARLAQLVSGVLAAKKLSALMVTNDSGQVMLRAEDPANWGDSVSSDSLVARAAVGKSTRGLATASGALTPRLIMKATTPVRNAAGAIVGTVTAGFAIDNAFVDGLKQSTGLASAIYSGQTRVATTLLAPDGSSRSVGVKETRTDVTKTVLEQNKSWSGLVTTNGQSYLVVYAPLRDADNAPVGMLFIGEPQVSLLQAAGRSIELTFLIAVLLLAAAVWPVHFIARSLARQLH